MNNLRKSFLLFLCHRSTSAFRSALAHVTLSLSISTCFVSWNIDHTLLRIKQNCGILICFVKTLTYFVCCTLIGCLTQINTEMSICTNFGERKLAQAAKEGQWDKTLHDDNITHCNRKRIMIGNAHLSHSKLWRIPSVRKNPCFNTHDTDLDMSICKFGYVNDCKSRLFNTKIKTAMKSK